MRGVKSSSLVQLVMLSSMEGSENIFDKKNKTLSKQDLEFWDIFLENDMYTVFYQRKREWMDNLSAHLVDPESSISICL